MSFSIFSFNPRPVSTRGFLGLAGAFFAGTFALTWIWVLTMPMAFLDPEYGSWRAKQTLLETCDIGDVLILGDSRASSGIMPTLWPVRATNLAIGGGEAIEALAGLTRALRCPERPRLVVISLGAAHFTEPDLFWERTARFGYVDAQEIAMLRRVSLELNDPSVYELRHDDGLPSVVRDFMVRVRFPSLYFASLAKGRGFFRMALNVRARDAAVAARGYYPFGTANGSDTVAADAHINQFRPLPVLSWYFEQILHALDERGIPSVFIAVPTNDSTSHHTNPAVAVAYRGWLDALAARYRGFHVVGQVMPHWPNQYFGDEFAHLNPPAAALFSAALGRCLDGTSVSPACVQRLQEAPPNTQNDAQYGWFNDTGADASARVAPSSKRGS